MRKNNNKRIVILMYHRVSDDDFLINKISDPYKTRVSKSNFFRQVKYLHENYKIISLNECVNQIESREVKRENQIVITFDDGYADNYCNAFDVLNTFNLPATIFLITNQIESGRKFWLDQLYDIVFGEYSSQENIGKFFLNRAIQNVLLYIKYRKFISLRNKLKVMGGRERSALLERKRLDCTETQSNFSNNDSALTWEKIREMKNAKITFGSHTCSHHILSRLPAEKVREEIEKSQLVIKSRLNGAIDLFAYPYGNSGSYNDYTKKILKELCFRCACTTKKGFNDENSDLFELKRIPIRNWKLSKFIKEINRFLRY